MGVLGPRLRQKLITIVVGTVFDRTRVPMVSQSISPPNVERQNVILAAGGKGPVHSSMFAQETPVPEKPVLHAHVKAPTVSVHIALVSQLLEPSEF